MLVGSQSSATTFNPSTVKVSILLLFTDEDAFHNKECIPEVWGRECQIGTHKRTRVRLAVLRVSWRMDACEFWVRINDASVPNLLINLLCKFYFHWKTLSIDPQRNLQPLCSYHLWTCSRRFWSPSRSIQYEHCDSSSSRIGRSTVLPICAIVLRVRHPPQPLPLPDSGPNSGVRGVRRGRMCGVARGCICVLLPPLEGSPHHGPSRGGGLPPSCILLAHLNSEGANSLLISVEEFWCAIVMISFYSSNFDFVTIFTKDVVAVFRTEDCSVHRFNRAEELGSHWTRPCTSMWHIVIYYILMCILSFLFFFDAMIFSWSSLVKFEALTRSAILHMS